MPSNPTAGNHLVRVLKQRIRGVPRTPRELNYSLQMLSVMRGLGWHQSVAQNLANGDLKPWYTYPALEWLAPRVKPTHRVFEFGGGCSTVWYSRHAGEVITVEHDSLWLDRVRTMVGTNATLLHRDAVGGQIAGEGDSPYYSAIEEYAPKSFDIIVIDGMERVRCASVAPVYLRDDGIIVFDNSDRPKFQAGIDHLRRQGFGRIDFYGFVATLGTRSCTSVFWRQFDNRWTTENIPLVWQGW